MRWYGKITNWNDERGFGFVEPDDGGVRAFVHVRAFLDASRRPAEHDAISYQLSEDNHGRPLAEHIEFISAAQMASRTPSARPPFFLQWLNPLALLISLPLLAIWVMQHGRTLSWPGLLYLLMSLVTFGLYGLDKRAAKRRQWRIPERTLNLYALCGGWLGAMLAQSHFAHKRSKETFMSHFWMAVAAHFLGMGMLVYLLLF